MSRPAILFALLGLCLDQGEALKCYTCSSATDPQCMDKVESTSLTECTPDLFRQGSTLLKDTLSSARDALGKFGIDTSDMKSLPEPDAIFACVTAVRQDGNAKVVLRSCSVPTNEQFDYCRQLKAQNAVGVTSCEVCNSDGCNGASGLAPSAVLYLMAAALALASLLARQ